MLCELAALRFLRWAAIVWITSREECRSSPLPTSTASAPLRSCPRLQSIISQPRKSTVFHKSLAGLQSEKASRDSLE